MLSLTQRSTPTDALMYSQEARHWDCTQLCRPAEEARAYRHAHGVEHRTRGPPGPSLGLMGDVLQATEQKDAHSRKRRASLPSFLCADFCGPQTDCVILCGSRLSRLPGAPYRMGEGWNLSENIPSCILVNGTGRTSRRIIPGVAPGAVRY
jgi:hypothetical protein